MATYKEIFGKQVKFLSSDPANEAEGQVWYNSTSGTFKSVLVSEAWSSSAPMISARSTLAGASAGTQTATVFFGGYDGSVTNKTEEYNGSGWSTGGNLGTARYYIGGSGTLTAGLGFTGGAGTPGGSNATGATEEYDGSTWTAGGTMSTARIYIGTGAGTQTATFCFGGSTVPYPPSSPTNLVEEYNGASWTSSPAMPRSSRLSMGFGTTTAAVNCGGNDYSTTTDEWNGTSWTEGGTLPVAKDAAASMGIQTAGMIAGGGNPGSAPGFTTVASKYDGTSWTALPAIATGRRHLPGAGTTTAAVIGGGETPPYTTATEEFNVGTTVITGGSWASGPTMTTGRYAIAGTGTNVAALATGGTVTPAYTTAVEKYDGSSWTAGTAYPLIITGAGSTGPQTAALVVGGYVSGPGYINQTTTFDGTNWTVVPGTLNTARAQMMGGCVGTTSAAMVAGGTTGSVSDVTETYNGSTWTTSPATLSSARSGISIVGISTAAVTLGGGAPTKTDIIQTWNGTSWTTSPATLNTAREFMMKAGASSTSALVVGGNAAPGDITQTELWDGTVAATNANLASAMSEAGGAGQTTPTAIIFGGKPATTATQEFTAETSAANYVTLTTS